MTETSPLLGAERGRAAAFAVYVLYLMSIPSVGILALIGLVVAYVGRDEATGVARSHIDSQIRIWWIAFWWAVALIGAGVVGGILTIVLIGFPILWLASIIGLIVMIWFKVKSVFGLIALLEGRAR